MIEQRLMPSENLSQALPTKPDAPIRPYLKYVVILLAIVIVFTSTYCFDNPAALQNFIEEDYYVKNHQPLGQAQFNLLYTVYSIPNIIIPFIGGSLVDRIGARVMIIVTSAFCLLGQLIFTFGGFYNAFTVLLVGRAVFGIGGEILQASQSTIVSNWFSATQLPLVLGICLSFPKLGSALNNYLTPIIARNCLSDDPQDSSDLGVPMLVSFFLMSFGVLCGIILFFIDRSKDQKLKQMNQQPLVITQDVSNSQIAQLTPRQGTGQAVKQQPPHPQQGHQQIKLSDILKLPAAYWVLVAVGSLAQGLFIPFFDNGNQYYVVVFEGINQPQDAGIYLTVPYVLSAVLVPIIGILAAKTNKRSILIIISSVVFVLTYFFMVIIQSSSTMRQDSGIRWLPVTFMGISVALYCTIIMPTLPTIVAPKLLGTAFGLMEVFQNIALAFFPIITGILRQNYPTSKLQAFHMQTLFFFIIACLLLGLAIILRAVDMVTGSKIDSVGKAAKKPEIQLSELGSNQESDVIEAPSINYQL